MARIQIYPGEWPWARWSIEQAGNWLDGNAPAREVHRLDDVLDDRHQHFALAVAHHPDVLRAVGEDFRDRAEASAIGQKNFASDRFIIVELARLGGGDVLRREHHDRALERFGRVYVGDAVERDSIGGRVERSDSGHAELA